MPNPTIQVPSPTKIREKLFPNGVVPPVALPAIWNAQVLFTPFGGVGNDVVNPSDQVMIGNITYDVSDPSSRLMRVRIYLLESLSYFDFLFRTTNETSTWWVLEGDPADPDAAPKKCYGPFSTTAIVPSSDFLSQNGFTHVGTWNVAGRPSNAFSAQRGTHLNPKTGEQIPNAGSWCWTDPATQKPVRFMNVDNLNRFGLAILGAFYLIDFPVFSVLQKSNLAMVFSALGAAERMPTPSPMMTYSDILAAMGAPPSGQKQGCTIEQMNTQISGISFPNVAATPPAWTNKVSCECIMMSQSLFPIYCQVWYDWTFGQQTTVFVFNDGNGNYTVRQDEVLPKGKVGPSVDYSWNGSAWLPVCCTPGILMEDGGFVPMPAPNFVELGNGICRALIKGNTYFGDLSIWSVAMGDRATGWTDFWYWFKTDQTGVIFSLAPASSLTLIDYQTFVQNPDIKPTTFDSPCAEVPECGAVASALQLQRQFIV